MPRWLRSSCELTCGIILAKTIDSIVDQPSCPEGCFGYVPILNRDSSSVFTSALVITDSVVSHVFDPRSVDTRDDPDKNILLDSVELVVFEVIVLRTGLLRLLVQLAGGQ